MCIHHKHAVRTSHQDQALWYPYKEQQLTYKHAKCVCVVCITMGVHKHRWKAWLILAETSQSPPGDAEEEDGAEEEDADEEEEEEDDGEDDGDAEGPASSSSNSRPSM